MRENACLALLPDQEVKNPASYAFYASSECFEFYKLLSALFLYEGRG